MDFITNFLNVSLYHQNDDDLYNGYGMNDFTDSYLIEASNFDHHLQLSMGNLSFEYCLSIVFVCFLFLFYEINNYE